MESSSAPRLWKGAFSLEERYTKEDMRGVVEYARSRGIRVIAEYDVPGIIEREIISFALEVTQTVGVSAIPIYVLH